MLFKIYDLSNDDVFLYDANNYRDALLMCYFQQIRKDSHTWEYEKLFNKYQHLIIEGKKTASIGDFCVKRSTELKIGLIPTKESLCL